MMTWTDFKALCVVKKNLTLQYEESPTEYSIWAKEEQERYDCVIGKDSPPTVDQSDFESHYKTESNWAIGQRPYPFATGDFDYARDGVFEVVDSDDFDIWFKIWDSGLYMDGGFMYCGEGFVFGTWAEMSIMDRDGVYAPAGTELKKWVRKSYIAADGKCEIRTPYAGNPPVNTWLRVRIHRAGTASFPVAVNFNLHKAI